MLPLSLHSGRLRSSGTARREVVRLYDVFHVYFASDVRRCLPFIAFALSHAASGCGFMPVKYSAFDCAQFSQKLVLCLLLRSGLDDYGCVIVTLSHTVVVFLLWLRLRPHRTAHTRTIALLLFSCVAGLQVYSLVNATRSTAAASMTDSWRFGFNVAMYCYVVCCIGYCLASAAQCAVAGIRGPRMTRRRLNSMHKSQLNHSVWVAELDGVSANAAARQRPSIKWESRATSRRSRVTSITSAFAGQLPAATE